MSQSKLSSFLSAKTGVGRDATGPRNGLLWPVARIAALIAMIVPLCAAQNLVVSPASLSFCTVQGTNPPAQTIDVSESGSSQVTLNPTVTTNVSWLTLSTANAGSTSNAETVSVQVNVQGLSAGSYSTQISISQTGLTGSPALVGLNLRILASGPAYCAMPDPIDLNVAVGANASSQLLSVATIGSVQVVPSFTATTASCGNFLSLGTPVASTLNNSTTVQVNFNTSGLPTGFCSGTIVATGSGVADSPLSIPVNLTVGATTTGPTLSISPAAIGFSASTGLNPAPMTLVINNTGSGTISPVLTTTTVSGGSWLTANLNGTAGTGGSTTATISVNDTGLPNGTYMGTITVADSAAINSPVAVPVTLTVAAPNPILVVSTNNVTFNVPQGSTTNATVTANVSNAGTGALSFTASATSNNCGNFLSVTPTSGAAPATLTISVNPSGLAVGVCTGTITVGITGTQTTQTIAVSLGVGVNVPAVNAAGIVNGASFTSTSVAAGEIVSIFGSNMGPNPPVEGTASGGFLQTTVAGTTVTFNGTAAPLYYVSPSQLNAQVPLQVASQTSATVVITANGATSNPYTVSLRPFDPAIFIANNGYPAILFQSGAQVTTTNSATDGQILSIYATGLGPLGTCSPSTACTGSTIATGQLAPTNGGLFSTTTAPTVTVGGQSAVVGFAGLAPGYTGLYQVNFTVPAGLTPGTQQLVLSISGVASPSVVLSVH